jgi:pilus assembly protein CpaE
MWIAREEDGQATVELVALLPALAAVVTLAWQALLTGETWWLTSTAARSAARAHALGGDPRAAARAALPSELRGDVRVRVDDDTVAVRVPVPSLIGPRLGSVAVSARMEPQS